MNLNPNIIPTFEQPLVTKNNTNRVWYSFFSGLAKGIPAGNTSVVSAGTSPYSYQAFEGGSLIVNGGSTTQIEFSRDGQNYYVTGQTAGMFSLRSGDILRITYSVAPPTLTWVPS
jgi:hypothetical protein